jgi:arabinose-5-phosphate isomerase
MSRKSQIIETARQCIQIEWEAIQGLQDFIQDDFVRAVEIIHQSTGRLVISGIGKSAIIAQKIVATLNSTGTPALFLHAADAIHGDLGMMQPNDVALLISKSGETPEIKVLVPLIKNFGNQLLAICGNVHSYLAREAHVFLNTTVSQEACPNNLAPTSSTTAQLVMGDALAVCLLHERGFTPGDFAKFHPGGALGKQLYLRVEDLSQQNAKPKVHEYATMRDTLLEISSGRLGAVAVVDDNLLLRGIITDGDLRRMLEKFTDLNNVTAESIMNPQARTIAHDALAIDALTVMRKHNISQLLVLKNHQYDGMVHIHDLLREGLV